VNYVTWREKVRLLKLQWFEDMRGQLGSEHARANLAAVMPNGLTPENIDDILDLLDRTFASRSRAASTDGCNCGAENYNRRKPPVEMTHALNCASRAASTRPEAAQASEANTSGAKE
jgi:hypothetical protein